MGDETMLRRARAYAAGATFAEVARTEGVSTTRVSQHCRNVVRRAGRLSGAGQQPLPELPEGLTWQPNYEGDAYYVVLGRLNREQVVWALAVLDSRAVRPVCQCCGRPL